MEMGKDNCTKTFSAPQARILLLLLALYVRKISVPFHQK